jgi:8-oxo-dGTP pyrophosphatase MutT (NUDIX family)
MEYIIASGPVIIENGKVLVDKHGDDAFWKFPGGRVEDFSSLNLEEHCKREAKEELGIDLEILKPLRTLLAKKGDTVAVLVHFLAKRVGEIKPGSDIREWAWLDIENLPADVAPNVLSIVKEYKSANG